MNLQNSDFFSDDALEPFLQARKLVENTIINLEERKRKIESYREAEKSGVMLSEEEQSVVARASSVQSVWENLVDLRQQFGYIASDTEKARWQLPSPEPDQHAPPPLSPAELRQQDKDYVKDLLLIQDVLENMRKAEVREDFLAGQNGAVKLSQEALDYLDEFYVEISFVHGTGEGLPPFQDQLQQSAEHLLAVMEGREKRICGTTYDSLRSLITTIYTCGYFEQRAEASVSRLDMRKRQDSGDVGCGTPGDHQSALEVANCNARNNGMSSEVTDLYKKRICCGLCKAQLSVEDNLLAHECTSVNNRPWVAQRNHFKMFELKNSSGKSFASKCGGTEVAYVVKDWNPSRTSTGGGKVLCAVCGVMLPQGLCLNKHTCSPARNPYRCTVCEDKLPTKTALKRHLFSHPGENPFNCAGCMARFLWRTKMVETPKHTCENMFCCSVCDIRFSQKNSLKKHIFKYHDKKLIYFPVCGVNLSESV